LDRACVTVWSMSSAGGSSPPEARRRRARRRVWIGLALLTLSVLLFGAVVAVAAEPVSAPGAPSDSDSDSGLAVIVPLIAASASLIGAIATLMTSFVTLWKLREETRQRRSPQGHES
jgi:hypothetical protein